MAAHARTRVRRYNFPVVGYYYNSDIGTQTRTVVQVRNSDSADVVGNWPRPNGLLIDTFGNQAGRVDGTKVIIWMGQPLVWKIAINCPVQGVQYGLPLSPGYVIPSSQEQNDASIRAMAATNPSRPFVSLPTFFAELKDIPETVRTWGNHLIEGIVSRQFWQQNWVQRLLFRGVPESYITNRWVIRPMVSDLTKMMKFQEVVEERFKLLRRLREEKAIRGRASASSSTSSVVQTGYSIESSIDSVVTTRTVHHSRSVWASCVWRTSSTGPNSANLPESDAELYALSQRLVGGVTSFETLATAWELIPWSWFVDWFTSVGSTIAAANNTVHANPGEFCVMCMRRAIATYEITSCPSWLTAIPGWEQSTSKWRGVVTSLSSPFSLSFLPLIEGRNIAILGSLAALRTRVRPSF